MRTNLSLKKVVVCLTIVAMLCGALPIGAFGAELSSGFEFAKAVYTQDNKIAITITMGTDLLDKNGTVLVALYDKYNRLLYCKTETASSQLSYFFDRLTGYCGKYTVKAFYFGSLGTINPLCNAVSAELEETHSGGGVCPEQAIGTTCTICNENYFTHVYSLEKYNDVAHWNECACGAKDTHILHKYYHACDAFCNECDYVRDVPSHVYSGNCDNRCNICGYVRNGTPEHTYSSECDGICDICTATRTVNAEHTYTNGCDADCDNCGTTREAPHTLSVDWKSDYYYHWHACACGKEIGDRGDHTFGDDGNCTVCGAEDKTSKGLTYELYQRNDYLEGDYVNRFDYKVTGIGTCTDEVIVIPKMHDYRVVSEIKEEAFMNRAITEVVLPDSIVVVGQFSFAKTKLKSVTIPGSMVYLWAGAFLDCTDLETVTIEEGRALNMQIRLFEGCTSLETINLRKNINKIDMYLVSVPNVTINYPGTMEEWRNIKCDDKWAYNRDGKYMCPTIACTDGTIKEHVYDIEGSFYNEYQHWTHQCSCGQPFYLFGRPHHNSSADCPTTGCDGCDYTGTFHNSKYLDFSLEYVPHSDNYHYYNMFCNECIRQVQLNKSSHIVVKKTDATHHWMGCTECWAGESSKVAHYGGTATCTEKAVCEDCGTAYGELLPHHGGTASCTEQARCEDCGTPYGELHHYSAQWKSDETSHWHACGVCEKARKDEEAHIPATTYTTDKETHWHACTVCGCKTSVENHVYETNGRCACGKSMAETGTIVTPGGGGFVVTDPERLCGHKASMKGDHSECAGCGRYRCDGDNHGLCTVCDGYMCDGSDHNSKCNQCGRYLCVIGSHDCH